MRAEPVLLAAGFAAVFVGCAPAVVSPTEEDALRAAQRWPGTSLSDLQRGRELYMGRCAGCHRLFPPDHYSGEQWSLQLDDMKHKAKLALADREAILRYLETISERARQKS